jgi:hypothetical protein
MKKHKCRSIKNENWIKTQKCFICAKFIKGVVKPLWKHGNKPLPVSNLNGCKEE